MELDWIGWVCSKVVTDLSEFNWRVLGNCSVGRPRWRWKNSIKMVVAEKVSESLRLMEMARYCVLILRFSKGVVNAEWRIIYPCNLSCEILMAVSQSRHL